MPCCGVVGLVFAWYKIPTDGLCVPVTCGERILRPSVIILGLLVPTVWVVSNVTDRSEHWSISGSIGTRSVPIPVLTSIHRSEQSPEDLGVDRTLSFTSRLWSRRLESTQVLAGPFLKWGSSRICVDSCRGRCGAPECLCDCLVIRAFYIIIFISYIIIWECYMNCYINVLHVLDDLWDFHTKSLFLTFNIWEVDYPSFSCLYCFRSFANPNN